MILLTVLPIRFADRPKKNSSTVFKNFTLAIYEQLGIRLGPFHHHLENR